MAETYKVRVQVYDEVTGELKGDVDVQTTADLVFFSDGQTFQQKLDQGVLKGQTGPTGATGATGENRLWRAITIHIHIFGFVCAQLPFGFCNH